MIYVVAQARLVDTVSKLERLRAFISVQRPRIVPGMSVGRGRAPGPVWSTGAVQIMSEEWTEAEAAAWARQLQRVLVKVEGDLEDLNLP